MDPLGFLSGEEGRSHFIITSALSICTSLQRFISLRVPPCLLHRTLSPSWEHAYWIPIPRFLSCCPPLFRKHTRSCVALERSLSPWMTRPWAPAPRLPQTWSAQYVAKLSLGVQAERDLWRPIFSSYVEVLMRILTHTFFSFVCPPQTSPTAPESLHVWFYLYFSPTNNITFERPFSFFHRFLRYYVPITWTLPSTLHSPESHTPYSRAAERIMLRDDTVLTLQHTGCNG